MFKPSLMWAMHTPISPSVELCKHEMVSLDVSSPVASAPTVEISSYTTVEILY